MNERTKNKLTELKSIPLFSSVGRAPVADYTTVGSWSEAIKLSADDVWSSVQLQVKNRLVDEVNKRDYNRFKEWKFITSELRQEIATILATSVEPLEKAFHLKNHLRNAVSWDMLGICIETEFSDLLPPMFFVPRLQPIYVAGHFPCGWEGPKLKEGWGGELPNSRLIIY